MSKVVIFLLIALAVALTACGAGQESFGDESFKVSNQSMAESGDFGFESSVTEAAFASPPAAPEPVRAVVRLESEKVLAGSGGGDGGGTQLLQTAERKVISTASISLEVESVEAAIGRARTVVEGMGGFVENLSSSGGSSAIEQYGNMTLRVPQDQFMPAVEAIEDLGVVQNRNLGTEDVSERFIDLEARLKSSLREEQSLLSLLGRTATVSEILTIERELSRVRADVERFQGQLNFLERRVDLATIHLSLSLPQGSGGEPPSAVLGIEVSDVGQELDDIKGLVASLRGSVDRAFLSLKDGRERADISLRVFTKDFSQTMAFLEASGDVKSKELTEGRAGTEEEDAVGRKPQARIQVSFIGEDTDIKWGLIGAIAASTVGILLVLFIGFLGVRAFQSRRRNGSGRFR